MAILHRALADADYRASSVLIALEGSCILVEFSKNKIHALRKLWQRSYHHSTALFLSSRLKLRLSSSDLRTVRRVLCRHLQFAGLLLTS